MISRVLSYFLIHLSFYEPWPLVEVNFSIYFFFVWCWRNLFYFDRGYRNKTLYYCKKFPVLVKLTILQQQKVA